MFWNLDVAFYRLNWSANVICVTAAPFIHFFYKNTLHKNTEAQITQKIRTVYEQWPGWMQRSKKTLERVRKRSNQLKLDTQMSNELTECTSLEETLQ